MNSIQNNFIKPHTNHSFLLTNPNFGESHSRTEGTDQTATLNEKKIGEVWSKHNFDTDKVKVENLVLLNNVKTTWGASSAEDNKSSEMLRDEHIFGPSGDGNDDGDYKELKTTGESNEEICQNADQSHEETSPSHHARRPPNAFLIFCKKHRPIVRQRYPTTENRGVTKILGEWWALLNAGEKQPYNDLAKEYKDAFLSANPGFRWYKLPAPPLRTLTTRPTTISKPPPATVSSPPPTFLSEFTPGKLADESQLGGLTSLMNNNYNSLKKIEEDAPCCKVEDNNNENPSMQTYQDPKITEKIQEMYSSPTNLIKPTLPPKPIKKRLYEQYEEEEKACAKTIFEDNGSMTHQDLLNKVVDGIFASEKDEPKEQRKSDRVCKGKRYERFMVEGRLLGNKRDSKLTQHHRLSRIESKIEHELTITKPHNDPPRLDLENTIKRLAERTNVKIDFDNEDVKPKVERVRSMSETSDGNSAAVKSPPVNFNLDLRIDNLPSLSYDDFIRRKRESKKRKMKIRSDNMHSKMQRLDNNNITHKPEAPPAVGSKKRKNKQSITHLSTSENETDLAGDNALLGLATLAMVAANTEKIGDTGEVIGENLPT